MSLYEKDKAIVTLKMCGASFVQVKVLVSSAHTESSSKISKTKTRNLDYGQETYLHADLIHDNAIQEVRPPATAPLPCRHIAHTPTQIPLLPPHPRPLIHSSAHPRRHPQEHDRSLSRLFFPHRPPVQQHEQTSPPQRRRRAHRKASALDSTPLPSSPNIEAHHPDRRMLRRVQPCSARQRVWLRPLSKA